MLVSDRWCQLVVVDANCMNQLTKTEKMALLKEDASQQRSRNIVRVDFLTALDWAMRLQVSKRTIFRMIDEGIIPPYDFSVGKTRRWRVSTYEQWVAEQSGRN